MPCPSEGFAYCQGHPNVSLERFDGKDHDPSVAEPAPVHDYDPTLNLILLAPYPNKADRSYGGSAKVKSPLTQQAYSKRYSNHGRVATWMLMRI